MLNPKIIALYLPQYHCIPENDKFWGNGFTDWVTVRNAKPLYKGHNQPRVPLDNNYYDLSQKESIKWQVSIAKEYGIQAFGIYHYWFNNDKNLLATPSEIIRDNDDIDIDYCFVWDNNSWKRSWSNVAGNAWAPSVDSMKERGPEILVEHVLGNKKDWEIHFNYLLSHFRGKKYLKIDNKPVFCIFNPTEDIYKMCEYWNILAQKEGFDGVYIIYQCGGRKDIPSGFIKYKYEPHSSSWYDKNLFERFRNKILKYLHIESKILYFDYDTIWKKILKAAKGNNDSVIYGAFAQYDDSPRRGTHGGKIVIGSTPQKFEKYFSELVKISASQNKKYIFLTAWNEWGEGAYIEPDSVDGYAYLEAIKRSLQNN